MLPATEAIAAKDVNVLKQGLHEKAKLAWYSHLEENLEISLRGESGPPPEDCNCSYQILDAQVQTPPQHPDFTLDFYSVQQCEPGQINSCNLFSGYFDTQDPFCGAVINPGCNDQWPWLPPNGGWQFGFPFNCEISPNSSFPVSINAAWYDPCPNGDYASASVTFRIVCINPCTGSKDASNAYTLTFDGPSWNIPTQIVSMGDQCGCNPI